MKNFVSTILYSLMFFSFVSIHAQIDLSDFESMKFRNIGPAGMSGRVTAIDVDLSDKDRIFIGSASGGVWKSENGGVTWEPLFDEQMHLSIGSVKINQNNPAEIYVGTGEGNPRNSANTGGGIYKTIDGGKSWTHLGLKDTKVIHRIIIHPDNSNIVLVGATGSPWGDSKDRGVYKTMDGGATWSKVLYVNEKTGVADMVANPNNPNHIIAAMWEHRRTPWDFVSGGKGSGLYVSYDAGDHWKKLSDEDGLPKGDLGRIGVAFAKSQNNKVYALVEAKENALYGSIDGGEKWAKIADKNIGNRPFYYAEIYVDPQNENRIYNLWSYVSRSEDGGKSFETIMDYGNSVHPDHHAFWIDPTDSNYLIDGNDGGLNISRDKGASWQFVANLPIGQFYHVNVDQDFPYHVYGGMQDNGSWVGPGFVLKRGGIRNNDWQELYFGDGFDVSSKPGDSRYGYAMSQGGNMGYYDRVTGKTRFIKPVAPDTNELRFNWNAALAQDPFNDCGLYFGSQYVHYSGDCGITWEVISKDLSTNDTTKQKQDISGGLTIDATNAENHTTILAIAPSPLNKDIIWASTDDGQLHITKDKGDTWVNISNRLTGLPANSWLPQIEVSKYHEGEAFVIANDYRRNNYSAYAYHTKDYGQTWRRIVDDNKVASFALSIVQDPVEENLLFLGTDCGLYVSFNGGTTWTHWKKNFPNVQVTDMKIQAEFHDLVISTFGRSLWVLDDIRPLRAIASEGMDLLKQDFVMFDPPATYLTSNRSYDGIRFVAQGEFIGDNKSSQAAIRYWVKDEKKSKNNDNEIKNAKTKKNKTDEDEEQSETEKSEDGEPLDKAKDKDKIYITIYNESGDTVRNFSRKVKEKGLQQITWSKNSNGVSYPSKNEAKKDEDPPNGPRVLPGIYKITMSYGDHMDSSNIEVKLDPRDPISKADLATLRAASIAFDQDIKKADQALKRVMKLKKKVSVIKNMMTMAPDSIQTQIKDLNKDIDKKIAAIEKLYMMPEDVKGIQRNPNDLNSILGNASYYIDSSWGDIGANAQLAIDKAHQKVMDTVAEIDKFVNDEWEPYVEKIKSMNLDPLSDDTKR